MKCGNEQTIEHYKAKGESRVPARYKMNKNPHGIAVIINNYSAYKKMPIRTGSKIDEENLSVMLKYLRYDVNVFRNLTAAQLNGQLLEIAAEDHQNFDSFVCCILGHGDCDSVYGTDGKLVKISELAGLFSGTSHHCPSLVSKPKLFIVQACCENYDHDKVNFGDALLNSIPKEADFLFAYSTPLEHTSWRSPRYGSWYISTLCKVFMNNAHHDDLLSMLTMVNKELSEAYTTDGYKQCLAPVTLLRKQVWFMENL